MKQASEPDSLDGVPEGWPVEGPVEEVALFLPAADVAALEGEAHRRGLTAAQMMRRLLREFLRRHGH